MRIVLIGFSGAGKSTVSKIIGAKLGVPVFEMDDEVLRLSGRGSINEIFDLDGEVKFREIEHKVAGSLGEVKSCVVSTGGGVVTRPENKPLLSGSEGRVIYLRTSFDGVRQRLEGKGNRPLFRDPSAALKLYSDRLRVYEEWAELVVETDGKTPGEVAEEIIANL